MPRLRQPRDEYATSRYELGGRNQHQSNNRLILKRLCDTCRWPERCHADNLCWHGEKRDIEREQHLGVRGVHTGNDPRGSNRIR